MSDITPRYLFREGITAPYFQLFRDNENSEIIHAECTSSINEREFPVYADELHEMRCAEDVLCGKCDGLILLADSGKSQRRAHSRLD